jgi:hypothetical protein
MKIEFLMDIFYLPTARPPFGQKIVPIFWPAGKTTARESFFREIKKNASITYS